MTTPLPKLASDNPRTGAWQLALLPGLFAAFLALHGLVHVVGFTVTWGLGGPRGLEYSTWILNGSIDIGDTAVKALSFVWLAAAVGFLVVAALVWRGHRWARRATIAVVLGSLVLCSIRVPGSVIGLGIDVALLALIAVVPNRLFVPRNGPARE